MLHILAQAVSQAPWEWAASHLQLIGWPTLCVIAWRVGKAFSDVSSHFTRAVGQIDQMATNHMPHVQDGILELVELQKVNNEKLDTLTDVLRG